MSVETKMLKCKKFILNYKCRLVVISKCKFENVKQIFHEKWKRIREYIKEICEINKGSSEALQSIRYQKNITE